MSDTKVVLISMAYCVVREVYFMWQTNKLLNKLMSRNYYDFQVSDQVGMEKPLQPIRMPDVPFEDYGTLQGISSN